MSIPAPRACFLACIAGWAIGGCTPADPLDPTPDPSTTGPPSPSTVPSDTTSTPSMPDPTAGPYPIVLAHGFFGFDDFAGLSFINYFWQVRDTLQDAGEPWVFTPAVDPYNDSWIRGGQLAVEVEAILETTGAQKVNLIGHSQGGLDARVVAHLYPEKVASVTTIATPHGGTQIADLALMAVPDSDAQDAIDWLLATFGMAAYDDFGNETSLFAALYQYSHEGITAFNAEFTDQPQVHYFSLTGRTDWHLGGTDCDAPDAPPFVTAWDAEVDPVDPLLWASEILLDGGIGDPYPNDGLLQVRNAKWGTFLGCVPADHLDQIGQVIGDSPGLGNDWDHRDFYLELVAALRGQGF